MIGLNHLPANTSRVDAMLVNKSDKARSPTVEIMFFGATG